MFEAEINVFIDKGIGHVKVMLPAVPASYGANGEVTAWGDPDPARITALYNALVAALSQGHELGREPPRQFGGAKPAKPEDPPPADLVNLVPIHCDERMVYKPAYKSQAGKDVGAKFQCRKGESCAQASTFNGKKYGFSIWEDKLRVELEAEMG